MNSDEITKSIEFLQHHSMCLCMIVFGGACFSHQKSKYEL